MASKRQNRIAIKCTDSEATWLASDPSRLLTTHADPEQVAYILITLRFSPVKWGWNDHRLVLAGVQSMAVVSQEKKFKGNKYLEYWVQDVLSDGSTIWCCDQLFSIWKSIKSYQLFFIGDPKPPCSKVLCGSSVVALRDRLLLGPLPIVFIMFSGCKKGMWGIWTIKAPNRLK